jgi:VanZ family protein
VSMAFFYGATDEYHQMFTQGREARIRDVFIDGIGAGVIIFYIYRFLPKLPKKIQTFLMQFGIN